MFFLSIGRASTFRDLLFCRQSVGVCFASHTNGLILISLWSKIDHRGSYAGRQELKVFNYQSPEMLKPMLRCGIAVDDVIKRIVTFQNQMSCEIRDVPMAKQKIAAFAKRARAANLPVIYITKLRSVAIRFKSNRQQCASAHRRAARSWR